MRRLHVLAVSDDGQRLLLVGSPDATRPGYEVSLDARLLSLLRGDVPEGEGEQPERALTPREVQARLRAGASVQQVARSAGVPVSRVERFAGPVLRERDRIVAEVRERVLVRPRIGPSVVPIGAAVDQHLALVHGLDRASITWSSRRRDDGCWVVRLDYVARKKSRTAEWSWRPGAHEVIPLDPVAAGLGHVGPGEGGLRPRGRPNAAPTGADARQSAGEREAAPAPAGRRRSTRRPQPAGPVVRTPASLVLKRPPLSALVAISPPIPGAGAAAAQQPSKLSEPAGQADVPAAPEPVGQADNASVSPAAPAAEGRPVEPAPPTETAGPPARSEPDPPGATVLDLRPHKAPRRGRTSVPSWDDVLLGVTPRRRGALDEAGPGEGEPAATDSEEPHPATATPRPS